uniref:Radical SAM domain protein n=1 Tax=Geobacter sp. (strain M21) TaxID=443144 RepID=C6E7Y0_GEOSM
MNITLIAIHPERSPQAVPLACAFLKEALLADAALRGKVEAEVLEFFLGDDPARCAESIASGQPRLVAFSVYVWSRESAIETARELRSRVPGVVICAGGAEPTANPAGLLETGLFDFLVRGEGEGPFLQAVKLLAQGAMPQGVPGVVLPGEAPGALPPPLDLEEIPSPYLSGQLDPTVAGGALWQLSRGCDFACAFCYDHKGNGGVRRFALKRIEAELILFARLQVPQVFVLDSTFNKMPQRAKEILRLIRKLAPGVHFHFEVRSEFIDAEMAELFASITCSLQIGLQSADPAVLRGVGRGFDRDDFVMRASLLNRTGAIFGFDLIYGLPGDSLKLFRSSLDFALSLYPNHLDIFPLAVLPGTRLHAKADALGLEHLKTPPYTVLSSATFSVKELKEASGLAAACDVFYSRGKAVAWFNAVVSAVKLSPSAFLAGFASLLGERAEKGEKEIAEGEIRGLQREFLTMLFQQRKKTRLLPLALDLADYHHYYAQALLAAPLVPARKPRSAELLRKPLVLSAAVTLARFHYEILDILEAGDFDLGEFADCFEAAGSCALIYPAASEVATESISPEYFELLRSMDGKRGAGDICKKIGLPLPDALDFLEFLVTEGVASFSR